MEEDILVPYRDLWFKSEITRMPTFLLVPDCVPVLVGELFSKVFIVHVDAVGYVVVAELIPILLRRHVTVLKTVQIR